MSGDVGAECHEFIDTGRCGHSDAEHDAMFDGRDVGAEVAACGCGHEWTQHDTPGCMFGWDEIPVLNGCDCERAGRA